MNEFDKVRKSGRLLYEYYRGSTLYNLNTPLSDIDTSGVFVCTNDELLNIFETPKQISDERHDNVWFEIGNLLMLLTKSNPTVLESIFAPKDKIIGEVHPLMQMVIDNRDEFVSKECFRPFYEYARSQIEKARGLNKKIVNPVEERLEAFDFIYTFKNQGSTKFKNWLDNRGLHKEFCGLNNTPNMHDTYGVFYDFGQHQEMNPQWREDEKYVSFAREFFNLSTREETISKLENMHTIGYRGVIQDNSTQPRLSSIEKKEDMPICHIYYNQSGFSTHCKQYHNYQEWKKNRNQVRYESNLMKNYDSKNMMHCFRMIHMAKEIARGEGIILERTWDREFLLDVRNHKFEYDELIEKLEKEKSEMDVLMKESTIRETVDLNFVSQLLIDIRKKQLKEFYS